VLENNIFYFLFLLARVSVSDVMSPSIAGSFDFSMVPGTLVIDHIPLGDKQK
jgi:hypothetical protein